MTARSITAVAHALVNQDRYAEAEPLAREALQIHEDSLPARSWKIAKAASILGSALTGLREFEAAEPLLMDSYPVIRDDRGRDHIRTRQALGRIITLYDSWNRPAKAERFRRILETGGGPVAARSAQE